MVDEKELEEARKVISEEGLVVFPTETAYGLAANALNENAIEKVYETKQRPRSKGLTVIASSPEQAEKYARLSEEGRKLVEEFMPGPLTLVSEKKEEVPDNLNEKFVFRIPGNETARKLAEETPITATSANIAGELTSYSIEDISDELLEKVDFVLDTGKLEESPTSTIVEVDGGEVTVHREGPIKKEEVQNLICNGS